MYGTHQGLFEAAIESSPNWVGSILFACSAIISAISIYLSISILKS